MISKKMRAKIEALLPNGIPRYVRVYDNGGPDAKGGSNDRYTVVYTGRQGDGCFVSMSGAPTHPQGICQHGSTDDGKAVDVNDWGFARAVGQKHESLGRRIKFEDLPLDCQGVIEREYVSVWQLDPVASKAHIDRHRLPRPVAEPEQARGDLAMPDTVAQELTPKDKPRDPDAGLPEGLDDVRFGPCGFILEGVGILKEIDGANISDEIKAFLRDPALSTPYKMARFGTEDCLQHLNEAEQEVYQRFIPSGQIEEKVQALKDAEVQTNTDMEKFRRRQSIEAQVLRLICSDPKLWAGILPEVKPTDLTVVRDIGPPMDERSYWSEDGYLVYLADWGHTGRGGIGEAGKPRIWYALVGPTKPLDTLPDDGLADGGERYTEEEMAHMETQQGLDIIFIGNDYYVAPGEKDPTGPNSANGLLDLLMHAPEDREDWAKLNERQRDFFKTGEVDKLDSQFPFGVQAEPNMPLTMIVGQKVVVYEGQSGYYIGIKGQAEEKCMGDGVDLLSGPEGQTLYPNTRAFNEAMREYVLKSEDALIEAYFGDKQQ